MRVQVRFDARAKAGILVVDEETGEDLTERTQKIELRPANFAYAKILKHRDGKPYFDHSRDQLDFEMAIVSSLTLGYGGAFGGENEERKVVHLFAIPVAAAVAA